MHTYASNTHVTPLLKILATDLVQQLFITEIFYNLQVKDHCSEYKVLLWAFGTLPVGVVMYAWVLEHDKGHTFGPLCCCMVARKASTMRSSANIMPSLWIQQWWHAILRKWSTSVRIMYKLSVVVVSLSVFGGNFVLAKVSLGLISVRCTELRGVCFSEVRNVLVNWGQVTCPLHSESAFWRVC